MEILLKSTLSEQALALDRLTSLHKAQKEVDELARYTLNALEKAREECGNLEDNITISDVRLYLDTLEEDRLALQQLSATISI